MQERVNLGTVVESDPELPERAQAEAMGKALWRITFPWGQVERIGGGPLAVHAYMNAEIARKAAADRKAAASRPA